MKKIFLLSTFVLTQTIFASTLTIYNSNIALVHESHEFEISKKEDHLLYNHLPDTLVDDSVNINFPQSVTLYSQVYKRKKITIADLAKKFIRKKVSLTDKREIELLHINGNHSIVKASDGKIFIVNLSELVFPYFPKDLQTTNSLDFHIEAAKNLKTEVDISYLAKNIKFSTDYILNIDKSKATLQAWIDITNNSGKDFKNTTVNLIAGDINRVHNYNNSVAYRSMEVTLNKENTISHKAIGGYHKYTLPFKVNLNAYEKRRIKLFKYIDIPIQNNYVSKMSSPTYLMGERSSNVNREITLKALNKALPAGKIRIYTKDEQELLLLGEESLQNTPKKTSLVLKIGKDFDTKVVQKVISRKDTNKRFNATIEYIIKNHSNEKKTVTLEIPFYYRKDAKVISNQKHYFKNANMLIFKVNVQANSQKSFTAKFISKRK